MQLLTMFPGRGKTGGVVGSAGRAGIQLRANTTRRQPRSLSQQANRAAVGSLAQLWRSLTPAQQTGWNALADQVTTAAPAGKPAGASGFNLFVGNNTRLLALVGSALIEAPPQAPAFAPVLGFAAQANYDTPELPRNLIGFTLQLTTAEIATSALVLRASPALSPGRNNIRPSELRILTTYAECPNTAWNLFDEWIAVYGAPLFAGTVTFAAQLLDLNSGFASPQIRAQANYLATGTGPAVPTTILIEVEGTPIANVTETVIEIEGAPIASPTGF